ncbi:MAG: hypothetical protein JJ896_04515 [Rhodothermales bacterium]|nr:hypothetical protein [Rhodothermales bacterium]MBO6778896.1 hypothetical protein [Rhodothermales bacterium]
MKNRTRNILIGILAVFLALAVLDSMGVFDDRPYFEVPHGNHTHYVPKECEPALPVSQAPTTRPGPGQTVDCQGQIVPLPE